MMKHGVANITNRKCSRNDLITSIIILWKPDVRFYEKYGTNINVTNTSFKQGTRTLYVILPSCCHKCKSILLQWLQETNLICFNNKSYQGNNPINCQNKYSRQISPAYQKSSDQNRKLKKIYRIKSVTNPKNVIT